MKLRVTVGERELADLLYQFLLERKPAELVTSLGKAMHAAATALEANDRALDAEWCAMMARRMDERARQDIRDEREFFRKMDD